MPDHYFSQSPSSARKPNTLSVSAMGLELLFHTDAGVFSKGELDPGSLLLLKSLPTLSGRVLDLGCGWGAIGVTLAKTYPQASFVLSDINHRAVELTEANIRTNQAANAVALQSDGFARIIGSFDWIITNPPIRAGKQAIYALFDQAKAHLNAGGALYIVIRKQQGAPSAIKHLEQVYASVELVDRDKGYWIIKASI